MNNKIKVIGLLCMVICIMSVVYATFASNLSIEGTGSVNSTWDIRITNIIATANGSGQSTSSTYTGTTASFKAELKVPGDYVEYTITVSNLGTLDAILNTVNKTNTGSEAIIVTVIEPEDKVLSSSGTQIVKVKVEYDSTITSQPTSTTKNITVTLGYLQNMSGGSSGSGSTSTNAVQVVSGDIDTVGSEIKIGDEHFYVISSDDTQVNMLAKYNLDIANAYNTLNGTGRQSSSVIGVDTDSSTTDYGTLAYSSTNYWSSTCSSYPCYVYNSSSNLYTYVENYETYLESLGAIIEDSRLIKYEELVALGCTYVEYSGSCKSSSYSWVYSTTYWSGSAANNDGLWYVLSNGRFTNYDYYDVSRIGVRPVITILKSNI